MFKKVIWIPCMLLFIFTCFGCTNPHTPAGHEGYVYENPRIWGKGGFKGVINGPGNFGVSLWNNKAINIDIRPTTYKEKFKILAKDDLNVSFNFEIVLQISPGNVQPIVQSYGSTSWYNRFVK